MNQQPRDSVKLAPRNWWGMLNEEGRPSSAYNPAQKAQRILYRVLISAVIGIGIFAIALFTSGALERLSGYDAQQKEGDWVSWWLYWLGRLMKVTLVTADVIFVTISSVLTTVCELSVYAWEIREEIRAKWRGQPHNGNESAAQDSPSEAQKLPHPHAGPPQAEPQPGCDRSAAKDG